MVRVVMKTDEMKMRYEPAEHVCFASTKDGSEVEIRFIEDIEVPNRGFTVDHLSAWQGTTKVGYLDVCYIPKARYKDFNPTIWHFLSNILGKLLIADPETNRDDPFKSSDREFREFVGRCSAYFYEMRDIDDLSDRSSLLKNLKKKRFYKKALEDEQVFKDFHVDKPYVSFVSTGKNVSKLVPGDNQGRGIGTVLYLAAAHVCDARGLPFHGTSLQQPRAKMIWDGFAAQGWTVQDGDRMRLDAGKIPALHHLRDFYSRSRVLTTS